MNKKQPVSRKKVSPKRTSKPIKTPIKHEISWLSWIIMITLLVITWIVYYPSLSNGFTNWDDPTYVLENERVHSLTYDNINYFFTHQAASNYHPLTMISLSIDYYLATEKNTIQRGEGDLNARPFHVTNLVLHLLNVLLVFIFIYHLSGKRHWIAGLTALFFAVHPMHVESIAWISERKDVLYTFFFLGGLILYLRYLRDNRLLYLGITAVLFILSLFSKPSAVVFPLVMFAIDYFKQRKFSKRLLFEKIPFLLLGLLFGIITFLIQSKNAVADIRVFSLFERFMFASYGFIMYLYKLVLPINIAPFYPYPVLTPAGYLPVFFYIAPVFVLLVAAGVFFTTRFTRVISFGFLFFFINIFLVIQFISVGSALMADRYTYVSFIGLFFIFGFYVDRGFRATDTRFFPLRRILAGLAVLYSGYLIWQTHAQIKVWNNSETLWTDVIEKYPRAEVSYKNRGNYYGKLNLTDKALKDYEIYLQLKKDDPKAYSNIGNIYGLQRNTLKALEAYSMSIKLDSTNAESYLNRAITYAMAKQFEPALKDYERAIRFNPGNISIYANRSFTLFDMGKYPEAINDYSLLIGHYPRNEDHYLKRGTCYYMLKQYDRALNDFKQVISLNPTNPVAYYNLSVTCNEMNDYSQAYQYALKARSLNYTVNEEFMNRLKDKIK